MINLCNASQGGINAVGLCAVTLDQVVSTGINLLLLIAFIAALGFLIFGGIRWIMSGGDKEATGKAKGTVTAALIGLVVVLGSWVLINIVITFFGGNGVQGLNMPHL